MSETERLRDRPWRIMEWVYPTDGHRYAICVDAHPTLEEASAACQREHPEGWVESAPEDVIPLKSATPPSR